MAKKKIQKYWRAELKNGDFINEFERVHWNNIKDDVVGLHLIIDYGDGTKQVISLPSNCEEYIQAKTASAPLTGGDVTIESRYVGCKKNSQLLRLRINELTNNISLEFE